MYLWKYWRESRITFGIAILALVVLTALSFKGHVVIGSPGPREYPNIVNGMLFVISVPMAILAWVMGSFGAGRSLGEGAGSYLLSRPRRRSWFIWYDWGFGMALLATLVILFNLLASWMAHRVMRAEGGPFSGRISFRDLPEPVSLIHVMSLNSAAIFLFCGIIFGVVYLWTILAKNALGVVMGAGTLACYLILGAVIKHYFGYEFPDLLYRVYASSSAGVHGLEDQLGLSLAVRAGIVMLFPIAAQRVLNRIDI